jgi:hypothetical protein
VTRALPTAAAVLTLALSATGCGWLAAGRPALSTADGPRLSRAALADRANAICARRTRALARLAKPRGPAQTRAFFARVAAIERAEAIALAGLRPPRDQERDFARLVRASSDLALTAGQFHAAIVHPDVHGRRRAYADAERLSLEYDRAARRLGLACRQTV